MSKLTAIKAKALNQAGRHSDGGGLHLYVKESGSKSWVLRLTVNGRRRDHGLGRFEDVTLGQARERANEIRSKIRSGIDPLQEKRDARAAPAEVVTFKMAAEAAHKEHKDGWRNPKHRAQWLSSLEAYAFPFIGDLPVGNIEGPAIRDLLANIWLSKPETARRVRQRIGAVLDWAYAKGLRQSEAPMRSLAKGLPRQPKKDNHFAALPYTDIPSLMASLSKTETVGRAALQFLILTAARSGEVRLATWSEIDADAATWTIAGERMKAGKTHIVPLPAPALTLLERFRAAYGGDAGKPLFPGNRGKPLSDMTLTKALRTEVPGDHTVHGFRSAFRDWAAEQTDFAGEIVEAALAHTISNKVEAAYRRTNYLEKRRLLMAAWAAFALSETGGTKVFD